MTGVQTCALPILPANPAVAAEDISKLVDWVMATPPQECPDKFTELAKAKTAAKP